MSTVHRSDVLILGAGLVGCAAALALASGGVTVTLVDPADPAAIREAGFDGRASALSSASWRMMAALGLGGALGPVAGTIDRIEIGDRGARRLIAFQPDLANDAPLGHMVENRHLRVALREAAAAAPGVTLIMPAATAGVTRDATCVRATLADGRVVEAALLVGAEGRRSPTRDAAGIPVARWDYRHRAIIGMLDHDADHRNVAHELFYAAGPFALLPMRGGRRSALVWTVAEADAAAMLSLGPRAFLAEAEKRIGGLLGRIALAAPLSSYPLGFHHAARITDTRLALIGDSGHGIHPIAGQGLNLGFRDAAALAEVIVDGVRLGLDPGDAQLLARYQRWRSLDTLMVAAATDTLTRLYAVPGRAFGLARRLGMGLVERAPPLKAFFMAEARGEAGELPRLLRGEPL